MKHNVNRFVKIPAPFLDNLGYVAMHCQHLNNPNTYLILKVKETIARKMNIKRFLTTCRIPETEKIVPL